jgi:hypothetical protein
MMFNEPRGFSLKDRAFAPPNSSRSAVVEWGIQVQRQRPALADYALFCLLISFFRYEQSLAGPHYGRQSPPCVLIAIVQASS